MTISFSNNKNMACNLAGPTFKYKPSCRICGFDHNELSSQGVCWDCQFEAMGEFLDMKDGEKSQEMQKEFYEYLDVKKMTEKLYNE